MKIIRFLSFLFFKELSCYNLSASNPVCMECDQENRHLFLEIAQLKKTNANLMAKNSYFKEEFHEIRDNHGAHHRAKRNTLSRHIITDFAMCGLLAKNAGVLSQIIGSLSDDFKSFNTFFDKQPTNSKNLKCSILSNHVGYLAHNLKSLLEDVKHFNIFIDKRLDEIASSSPLCADGKVIVQACDAKESNGKWTVIQRRMDGKTNFYRGWDEYKRGFGTITGEFFIGLECLHLLTTCASQELLIEMEDHENQTRYAIYDIFQIGDESEKYVMKYLGKYNGNAGDSLRVHKSQMFSTFDQDNDKAVINCAQTWKGAWWYNSCHYSNLNGEYGNNEFSIGINWYHWHGHYYSLKKVEMKIRPNN